MSFRKRLIIGILMISTIPLLFVAYFSYIYITNLSEKDMIKYSTGMAQRSLDNFNALTQNASNTLLEAVSSTDLNNILRNIKALYSNSNQLEINSLNAQIDKATLRIQTIYAMNSAVITGINVIADGINKTVFTAGDYVVPDIYQQVKNLKGRQAWILDVPDRSSDNKGKSQVNIFLSSAVLNVTDNRVLGVVNLHISEAYIQKIFGDTNSENGEYSVILTDKNQIVLHPDVNLIGSSYSEKILLQEIGRNKNGYKIINVKGEKSIVTYATSEQNGWKIINIIPYSNITNKSFAITKILIYIALLSLAAAIITAVILSFSIYRPVSSLSQAMNRVDKGNLDIKVNIERKDEFGMLGENFNKLMHRINVLITQVEQEQLMKKEAEISALRAQINPHFLYNTLNVIKCLAKAGDTANIEQVSTGLIDLLRISIGNKNEVISIQDEVKYVHSYIKIQKLRLDKEFEFIDEISEELYGYAIPKFTLQPVVENAIIHGFEESLTGNIILIRGFLTDMGIRIEVIDNGKGMNEDKQSDLQKLLDSSEKYRLNKVGIVNVIERIKIQFGQNYGIQVQSHEGKGTKICILLPALPIGEINNKT